MPAVRASPGARNREEMTDGGRNAAEGERRVGKGGEKAERTEPPVALVALLETVSANTPATAAAVTKLCSAKNSLRYL